MPTDPEPAGIARLIVGSRRIARRTLRAPSDEALEAVAELLPTGDQRVEYLLRFSALIVLSSSIAAFGLLSDSAAVVIGAMLVAPLMTPILATAAALVRAMNREVFGALAIIMLGTALAVAVGYAVSFVGAQAFTGTNTLPREVSARTFPGLLDLGVAVTAGAAAGYILPRRSATSALPGVGISVALVPPLVVVGITLEVGASADAANAMLLFLTNLSAIVFAVSVMLLLVGFRPHREGSGATHVLRIVVTIGTVLAVAVPLTFHTQSTLSEGRLRRHVVESVEDWDSLAQVLELKTEISGDVAAVSALVTGPNEPEEVWRLAREIQSRFGGPVEFELRYAKNEVFEVVVR